MLARFFILSVLFAALIHPAKAQEGALVTFKSLNLETALELAEAALADCRKRGFQVAVAVVDRSGILQVTLRDRFAGPHTPETARRKAWTAINFRTNTGELADLTQPGKPQSGARDITNVLMLGGGVPVEAAGALVAGVGVSGAPGGDLDEACAQAGIEAIADKIAF
ncbi:MAG: heme-binding protein [Rhodospirillales bacterium]|nr:heme-binding protein [Rhodospirillales bacterium]